MKNNHRFYLICFMIALLLAFYDVALAEKSEPISDAFITTKIKAKLLKDYHNVHVSTNEGIVTLTGTVNAQTDAQAVLEKVDATKGVKSVNTQHFT